MTLRMRLVVELLDAFRQAVAQHCLETIFASVVKRSFVVPALELHHRKRFLQPCDFSFGLRASHLEQLLAGSVGRGAFCAIATNFLMSLISRPVFFKQSMMRSNSSSSSSNCRLPRAHQIGEEPFFVVATKRGNRNGEHFRHLSDCKHVDSLQKILDLKPGLGFTVGSFYQASP